MTEMHGELEEQEVQVSQIDEVFTLGQRAYEAYVKHTGGVSLVSGRPLPGWAEQSPELHAAWEAAADAAVGPINDPLVINLTWQHGPISEGNPRNGVGVEEVIELAMHRLTELNMELPHQANAQALEALNVARSWLLWRTADRQLRGVEGTTNP